MTPTTSTTPPTPADCARTLQEVRGRLQAAEEALELANDQQEAARAALGLSDGPGERREAARAKAVVGQAEEALAVAQAAERVATRQFNGAVAAAEKERQYEAQGLAIEHTKRGIELVKNCLTAMNKVNLVVAADAAIVAWSREAEVIRQAGGSPARLQGPSTYARIWDTYLDASRRLASELADDLKRYSRPPYVYPEKETDDDQ
jgi:hypothetical protein